VEGVVSTALVGGMSAVLEGVVSVVFKVVVFWKVYLVLEGVVCCF
jgi:hypothetical protein